MAKKKVTCEIYAQVQVPDGTDPEYVNRVLQRACNNQGWGYTGAVSEDMLDEVHTLESVLDDSDE
jgi:hypothetical protein